MSTYLQIDLMNEPFRLALTKRISLSKILSGVEKTRIKKAINKSNFINILEEKFNKTVYTLNDIDAVIQFLKGNN